MYREDSQNEYNFHLEAAISTSKQIDEDRLTYLNKGSLFSVAVSNVATRVLLVHCCRVVTANYCPPGPLKLAFHDADTDTDSPDTPDMASLRPTRAQCD